MAAGNRGGMCNCNPFRYFKHLRVLSGRFCIFQNYQLLQKSVFLNFRSKKICYGNLGKLKINRVSRRMRGKVGSDSRERKP